MAERLPNGHRTVAGAERIALWASMFVLVVGGLWSYFTTTTQLDSDLDRNCRILVRIDGEVEAVLLIHGGQDAEELSRFLRDATVNAPQEICG